jgi:uncharacterized membrane protein
MARRTEVRLDSPKGLRTSFVPRFGEPSDRFGRFTEGVARAMGTPWFLVILTVFCALWLTYNVLAPGPWRFDSAANGFTALTLMLSLQASYAAPLILLAQNRQESRDRVAIERDREQAAQSRADMDYLAREIAGLRMSVGELATRDYLRSELRTELRSILADLDEDERDRERTS